MGEIVERSHLRVQRHMDRPGHILLSMNARLMGNIINNKYKYNALKLIHLFKLENVLLYMLNPMVFSRDYGS